MDGVLMEQEEEIDRQEILVFNTRGKGRVSDGLEEPG